MAKFKADLDAQKYKDQIEADTKEGQAVGVNGTPAVFINGRKINGAYPLETFKKIADDELKKKKGKRSLRSLVGGALPLPRAHPRREPGPDLVRHEVSGGRSPPSIYTR